MPTDTDRDTNDNLRVKALNRFESPYSVELADNLLSEREKASKATNYHLSRINLTYILVTRVTIQMR